MTKNTEKTIKQNKTTVLLQKIKHFLFIDNLFTLLFSYKGHIGRTAYGCGLLVSGLILTILRGIHPLTGIFALILKLYCLPALIQKRSRSFNSKGTWSIISLFVFILTLELTYNEDLSVIPYAETIFFVLILQFFITQLILLFRPIKNPADNTLRSCFTKFPPVTALSLICIIFGALYAQDKYLPQTNSPAFRLGMAIGEIYRHKYGYPEFCRHYGYEMRNYPQQVTEQYYKAIKTIEADQMKLLNRTLPNKYQTIEEFYNTEMARDSAVNNPAIHDFFEPIRRKVILIQIANEQAIPDEELLWKDEYNNILGYDAACKAVDNDAEFFVTLDCFFSHILNYVGLPSSCQYQ